MEINASNYQKCIARIAARGKLNPSEAEALLEEVAEAAERQRISGSEDPIVTAAWGLVRNLKEQAENKKADALLNARVRLDLIGDATAGGSLKGAMNYLRGKFFWLAGQDSKENVQSLWHGLSSTWISTVFSKLNKDGLMEAARSPEMFQQVARELWELRSVGPTRPNASPARQIAEIIFEQQEAQRARLNSYGARIGAAVDWIATTSHDAHLIRRGGRDTAPAINSDEAFTRWWTLVKDRLAEKTYDDITPKEVNGVMQTMDEAREAFGRDVFNSLYTGVHMRTGYSEGPKFEGGGFNVARKLSEGRTLYWKDADAWTQYMQQYGRHTNWLELAVKTGDFNARRAALMKYFGTNPASNLRLIMENIAEQYRDKDPSAVENFLRERTGFFREDIRDVMKLLDGTADRPANEMAAQVGRTARGATNMMYLGGVQLTHFASLFTTVSSDAMMHGEGVWSSLGNMMGSLFKNLKADERLEMMAELGAYGDGLKRHVEDHFAHGMSLSKEEGFGIPGAVAQGQDWFMTATGLPYIFDHVRSGHKAMLANKYARQLDKAFPDLKPPEQTILRSYGVGPEEWATLKTAIGDLTESNGRTYLTPNLTASIDRNAIETLLRSRGEIKTGASAETIDKKIFSFRDDLADKLTMMYQDAAELSVVSGGVRQQAMLKGSTSGTWRDEIMQAVTQFHSWPIAATQQILARQFYENAGAKRVFNLGILAGMSMLGGYIRAFVRDTANGVEPQQPQNVGEAVRLGIYWMAQGGVSGIIGDWIGGELNRTPNEGYRGSMGGPLFGSANELFHTLTTLGQEVGSDKDTAKFNEALGASIGKSAMSHVPFANLLYLKGAYSYLIMWHAIEAMKPGWWQRTNATMEREQHRTHFGYKPYQPVPYTPWE